MKVKKFKFKQILKLHLLNSKAYKYLAKKSDPAHVTNITEVVGSFKKALQIIFQFHNVGKKILFVGIPKKLELKINKLTFHVAVPGDFDLQGLFSNNLKPLKGLKMRKQPLSNLLVKALLPKLVKRPDLIVLFSSEQKQNFINESFVAKVPILVFSSNNSFSDVLSKSSYVIPITHSNFVSSSDRNLLFLGLNFLFKTFKRKVSGLKSKDSF